MPGLLHHVLLAVMLLASAAGVLAADVRTPSTRGFHRGADQWIRITGADESSSEGRLPRYRRSQVEPIAENLLIYQNADGGWPKNLDMCIKLSDSQAAKAAENRGMYASTFDNGATHSQLRYLAAAQAMTDRDDFRQAFQRGLEFVLDSQYENGGWPQTPGEKGYPRHITFNDDAMVGVMRVLQEIALAKPEYDFVSDELRQRCTDAYRRGLECIVDCQIEINGRKTAWCQQHDYQTLEPVDARVFEKPSLCSGESAGIVKLLMAEPKPSPEIIAAVESAVAWFRETELHGIRVERRRIDPVNYTYHTARTDKFVVDDPQAPVLWARFYEMETFRPLFCGRDGVVRYSLAEIDQERRTGYAWYVRTPASVYRAYDRWKQRVAAAN